MRAIEPLLHDGAHRVTFAAHQPQYHPLPASVDETGCVMTEWMLSAEDLAMLLEGGRIRIWLMHTGVETGRPFTPMGVEITNEVTSDGN